MHRILLWSIVSVVAFFPAFALDPQKSVSQFSVSTWTQQQGLPQDTIWALAQTSDGYLWAGTAEGLARFDGYEFTVFNREHNQLPSNSVTALAAGPGNSLWIGTSGGVTEYRDGKFRTLTSEAGLPAGQVGDLFVDHSGALWIVVGGNISRYDSSGFHNFMRERDLPMRSARGVTEDEHHTIYVAGNSSVAKLENGKFVEVLGPQALSADFPTKLHADSEGNLWIIGVRGIVKRFRDGTIRHYSADEGATNTFGPSPMVEDRDGNLWWGKATGLARLERSVQGKEAAELPLGANLGVGPIGALLEDSDGNLWAGGTNGLARLRDDAFTVFRKSEGLPSDGPTTVFEDSKGQIWVGFLDGGIAQFSSRYLPGSAKLAEPKGRIFSIRESKSGDLLIASRDGLTRIAGGQHKLFVPPDPHGRRAVYDVLEDSEGTLWLAVPNGLMTLKDGHFRTVVTGGNTLEESAFVTLAKQIDGSVWAGSLQNGLWHFSGQHSKRYMAADGLVNSPIRHLYVDGEGVLWISTNGGGLSALRNGKFFSYRAADGLLSDSIANVIDDGTSLWLSTPRGLCRISKQQLSEFSAGTRRKLEPVNYGVADGLPSSHGAPGFGAGGIRDSQGNLWFVTTNGIARYSKDESNRSPLPPLIHITELATDKGMIDWPANSKLPAGTSRLRVRYTGIYLRAPEVVKYSYKLDGLDSDWVSSGDRRNLDLTSLSHGRYTFHMRAEVPGGKASEESLDFEIIPRFYETNWFRAGVVLLFILLGVLGYKFRVQQVRSRFAAVLEERTRIAREIHDTLAQAFVGIASQLDTVEMFISEDTNRAKSYLDTARRMTRHSLTEARRAVVDLRAAALDEQDLAAALESGAQLWTAGSGMEVDVDVEGDSATLPENLAHQVLRIAQEAVTNVVKHAGANHVSLRLSVDPGGLQLNIVDDGRGFDASTAFASGNEHFGLIGMRERAKRMGGNVSLVTRPGEGTELNLKVPVK